MHDWILEGLPPKVLAQHKKILGINEKKNNYTTHSVSNDGTSAGRTHLRNDNGWMKQQKSSLTSKTNNQISISSKATRKVSNDKSF